ncbi:DNA-directed RNA polymerase mitochondrial [Ceratocystis platani]|uniref:DNA-directed RNA polymerase n=1 Tax=Ceratocystis fimbriata f. sp. platani TaxID=88771 RepID=A0A0F8B6W4_CERFI|nr:DNA-directed RNA polymerase mitochondrial [Ceratocystis platani]
MLLRPAHRAALQRANARQLRHMNHNDSLFRRSSSSLSAPTSALSAIQAAQRRQQLANAISGSHQSRSLATAVDGGNIYDPLAASPIMGASSTSSAAAASSSSSKLTELTEFDITNLIRPEDHYVPLPARKRGDNNSLPTEAEDIFAVFEACLQVNKLDRAAIVLRRLGATGDMPAENLIYMHNQFLKANLDQLRLNPSIKNAEALHQWYEVYIRSTGLPHTAETIAYMLRASILSAKGPRLNRLITRYMDMAPGNIGLQVLAMDDILSAQDLALITENFPRYNFSETESLVEPEPLTATDSSAEAAESSESSVFGMDSNSQSSQFTQVLETEQKGLGLKFLKETLTFFNNIPEDLDVSTLPMEQRHEIQSRIEKNSISSAMHRWREEHSNLLKMGLNTSISHHSMSSNMFEWHKALEARFVKELEYMKTIESKTVKDKVDLDRGIYSALLLQADPSRLAATTIIGTVNAISIMGVDRGATIISVCNSVSKLAEEDIDAQNKEREARQKKLEEKASKRERTVTMSEEGENATVSTEAVEPTEPEATENVAKARTKKKAKANATHDDTSKDIKSRSRSLKVGPEEVPGEIPTIIQGKKPQKKWSPVMHVKVGAFLLSCLFETAKITAVRVDPDTGKTIKQVQPAFTHANQLRKGKKVGMVIANNEVIKIMKSEPQGSILAKHLPMLVPPQPWEKYNKGAYLEYKATLIRVKGSDPDQKLLAQAANRRGDLQQVSRGLDILGQTAWRVNNKVFDVLLEAWNTGEAIADLPPLYPDLPLPEEPKENADIMERRSWIRAVKAIENERSGLHSNRCFINFQLEIARAYRNQTFYFPHNIDFRGRAYPLPTYLNHMGADHVRGLLIFGKGRPLGEKGLRWLKIHLANVAGYDKASLDEREAFAMEHLQDIYDSATNPLTGKRWWLKSEDAWQTLAACFELKAALDSPDPSQYVSHLPVHQDGTCNGLQHYAALGGDEWGARQVNLEPGERPADVYTAVANLVNDLIAKDVKVNNCFAMAVQGKITRKVVKQTVMTNVYGVTFQGAKKQVAKQLDAYYPNLSAESGFPAIVLGSYIATQIFRAMSTMFRGAHDIQSWLGEVGGRVCNSLTAQQVASIARDPSLVTSKAKKKAQGQRFASDITTQFNSTLVWTTPLRLPVSQPYRKNTNRAVVTCLQDMILTDPNRNDPVDRRKQLQAFPPNFIHSLDASHMLLSALRCNEKGLEFAAVHDSFWTHASDVDDMSSVLRDAFISIHQEDVIGRLAAEFRARYKDALYLAKVDVSSAAGSAITAWRKKTKTTLKEELQMEELRRQLLTSSDPKEVNRGKAMVTPATIVAELKDDGLLSPDGAEELAMGNINSGDSEDVADMEVQEPNLTEDEADAEAQAKADPDEYISEQSRQEQIKAKFHMSSFEMTVRGEKLPLKARKTKTTKAVVTTPVWLPLSFPEIPAKGDFDVRRLRESKYFFS